MNPLDFLNNNPALLSIIAFPLGLLLLLGVAKLFKVDKLLDSFINALNKNALAQLKVEERIRDVVEQIKNIISSNWDTRRYLDDKFDYTAERFDRIDGHLSRLETLMPKRKEDV